ncbi:NAD(P)/FAD-dependent oxidoreductase [Nocardioides sp. TF02-7]|uniref:flavin-containing monooxygenase n=1 Tax=Nocardioides sp. TF02-7 TaxID=2917724 RepID=UPI001F06247F|nr:NAD(P)/FAD-dependent oxidoreductase [Nocardioides sp. TF02-7]UMG91302.1 NAD(P)/FAD-dependent oxidoreductase [Nocardioides sp. TF02-7]
MNETQQAVAPGGAEAAEIFRTWLTRFERAVESGSSSELARLFTADATWRDFMAFAWDFSHALGREDVAERLVGLAKAHEAAGFAVSEGQPPTPLDGILHCFFDFTTRDRRDRGYVGLVRDGADYVASVMQTQVCALPEHPEGVRHRRPEGKAYRIVPGRPTWREQREREASFEDGDPAVVVLGAGHNGLSVAARLRALGVPTLVIDREARVGDTWRRRYAALALHSTVYGDNMPYLPFPPTWTAHTPKDKFADWLESYAQLLDLNVWLSTTYLSGHYDEDAERWTLRVRRGDGSVRELRPRHFVVAGGLFGSPRTPRVPGLEGFTGVALHSDDFHSGADFEGQRALVVGAGVSGHELAQDLYEHGVEVTMLQRSATYVINYDTHHKYWSGQFTEYPVFPPEYADQIAYALPNERVDELNKQLVARAAEEDRDLHERLTARGFKLEWGPDGTGIIGAHMSGMDGYQINIGASELVADGRVALKQGTELVEVKDGRTVVFDDGSELEVDVIVFATGYEQMWNHMRPTLGAAAARIEKAYGRADDNEYANTWRRSAQPGLWFCTGFIRMCRFYSTFTALLIKAIEEGDRAGRPGP